MRALDIISAVTAINTEEINQHRTDLLRQQLRSRGIRFVERLVEDRSHFAVVVELDGVEHDECMRLARRYGQSSIIVWREDDKIFRYHLAPGNGGPAITSIEELTT